MHLKLRELQAVVKSEMKKDKSYSSLREEIFRVFGPSVMVSHSYDKVFEAANEQLDIMESSGRAPGSFKLSVLIEAASLDSASARKLSARLLPERYIQRLVADKSSAVRCAAAKRLPLNIVKEAVKKFPGDEALRSVARDKRLSEAGLPNPKPVTEPFDMYGDKPMGDSAKTGEGEAPSDDWYDRWAHKLCAHSMALTDRAGLT